MDKRYIGFGIGLFAVLILIITNPKLDEHKEAVRSEAGPLIQTALDLVADSTSNPDISEQLHGSRGKIMHDYMVNDLSDNGISRGNYLLFSITKLNHKNQKGIIGYGILGNVFLTSKLETLILHNSKK